MKNNASKLSEIQTEGSINAELTLTAMAKCRKGMKGMVVDQMAEQQQMDNKDNIQKSRGICWLT